MSPGATSRGFAVIDHTADVGIRAWGANSDELFAAAAEAMFSILYSHKEPSSAGETITRDIDLSASDWSGLLYDWLSELLYLQEVQSLVLQSLEFVETEPFKIRALAKFEAFSPGRHERLSQIKAVTFHGLDVTEGPKWEVQVIFDV